MAKVDIDRLGFNYTGLARILNQDVAHRTNGLRAVRQMTTLTQINDLSPQDFWTQYDAGKFNPPREQLARWPKGYKGDPILRLSPEARKMKLEVEQPDAEVQPEGAPSD